MPTNFNQQESRAARRAKRRKTNIILNTLITIVVILILLVGGKIFFGGEDDFSEGKVENEQQGATNQSESPNKGDIAQDENKEQDQEEEFENQEIIENEDEEENEIVELETDEPNVQKVFTNPNWEPVGTEQSGGHQPSYKKGSIDWNEKHEAIAYAVNIPVDQMTTWWIEGGADREREAVATVSAKNDEDTYRVYIEWVDGEGWKPTEVKKLIKNDKKR